MKVVHINLTGTAVIEEPLTACIGYFDGLHLGHQKLIEEVKRVAARRNTRCALITFDPDPWCDPGIAGYCTYHADEAADADSGGDGNRILDHS
ncbi:MAG: adenylyltransferase/cytidyltransferase family protein [Clostridium sp.]